MQATCPTDGQRYGVALQSLKARPGYRTEPVRVMTTLEDIYGKPIGRGYKMTDHWVNEGAPVNITFHGDDGTQLTLVYSWPHGDHRVELEVPATDLVTCGACTKRADAASPPDDYYSNPRYGMACACCGQQGTHLVVRGGDAPACLKGGE